MAVAVVAGPPFSGKTLYAKYEIERREKGGELGLFLLGWSELFRVLYPGDQTAFRDEAVSDTGAPRLVGAAHEWIVGAVLARELSGYVVTQSPARAVELADRFDGPLLEVVADVGDVADRVESHMTRLRRTVTRAVRNAMLPKCRKAAVSYFRESSRLVGRAREVRRSGRGYKVDPRPKRAFDRALWERGLTPRGREALAELKHLGNPEPSPSDVMAFLLRNPVEA